MRTLFAVFLSRSILWFCVFFTPLFQVQATPQDELFYEQTKRLGKVSAALKDAEIHFSIDGQAFAYVQKSDGKQSVVVNGQEGKKYDAVGLPYRYPAGFRPYFTEDFRTIYYWAREAEKHFVVVNQKEGPRFDGIERDKIYRVKPDRIAYVGYKGHPYFSTHQSFFVIDSQKGSAYKKISVYPAFSNDGQKIAVVATRGVESVIVVNGKEIKKYQERVDDLRFSPDGKLIWTLEKGERVSRVVDGQEGPEYEWMYFPKFSPDGSTMAYEAKRGDKSFLVINGREGKAYDDIEPSNLALTISKDGKVAYTAKRGNKNLLVVNEQEGKEYDSVCCHFFSPDGKHLAYVVRESRQEFVVFDHQEGERYDSILLRNFDDLKFSSYGSHLAYVAKHGNKEFLVVNGQEEKKYQTVLNPNFSTDGNLVYYSALSGGYWTQVVRNVQDGKESLISFGQSLPQFILMSPHSNRIVFIQSQASGKQRVVTDGKPGKEYDRIWHLHLSPDGKFVGYNARSGDEIWWVVEPIIQ